nr:MarR family transcriptional regulator [Actinoplanes sp. ATCC 53533]
MQAWWPLSGLISKLPAALDRQLQTEAGISHFEYMVLSQLSAAPQRTLRMGDLAELANGSVSRLSHAVTRLERRAWIRREPSPENGRYMNATLTDEGFEKVAATAPGHVRAVRALVVDALSPTHLRQLREISELILRQIDADAVWPPPERKAVQETSPQHGDEQLGSGRTGGGA